MGHAVSVIFPVLTVIIGGACILLFSVTTTLRASNTDLRERVKELEAKDERNAGTIKAQAAQIDALGKVVTGEAHLVAIGDLLTEHHAEAKANWVLVTGTLGHVDETMERLADALGGREKNA